MKKWIFGLTALTCLLNVNYSFAEVRPGQKAPDFSLINLDKKEIKLSDYKGKFVVLEWFNKDCPFVKKHYDSKNMQSLQEKYTKLGVEWIIINSSAPGKQGNEVPALAKQTLSNLKAFNTQYLIDDKGVVGQLYGAKTTPHMYIINPANEVIYAGAIDSIKSADIEDIAKAKNYVSNALDLAMNNKEVDTKVSTPYGCSVKY